MTKRQRTLLKSNGRCAYCGKVIEGTRWQVDHIHPRTRGGTNHDDNLRAACQRCNQWKSAHTTEGFRRIIAQQIDNLESRSPQYRLAVDYKLLAVPKKKKPIVFYFETLEEVTKNDRTNR